MLVERAGYEVLRADSCAELVAGLTPPPDAVICDLQLPDGDPLALLEPLCGASTEQPAPLILTTGASRPDLERQLGSMRPAEILYKPFRITRLVEVLAELLPH